MDYEQGTEAPAPVDIVESIRQMNLAKHEDIAALNEQLHELSGRVSTLESTVATFPATYASSDAIRRVADSQQEYEQRSRQLTEQVANLVTLQADSQRNLNTIESRLSELPTLRQQMSAITRELTTMTGNLDTFMRTQRENADAHTARLDSAEKKADTAAKEAKDAQAIAMGVKETQEDAERRFITGFLPVRDFIEGSATQKPLKDTLTGLDTAFHGLDSAVNGLRSDMGKQSVTLRTIEDYIKSQQEKEDARRNFYRRVRLQLLTPQGLFALMVFVVGFILLINAIDLDQLFQRVRQFADSIQLLKGN